MFVLCDSGRPESGEGVLVGSICYGSCSNGAFLLLEVEASSLRAKRGWTFTDSTRHRDSEVNTSSHGRLSLPDRQ